MKKLLYGILLLMFNVCLINSSAVSYEKSGGRLGDNLLAFSQALWVSYQYNLPLIYNPFEHAEWLRLSILHKPISGENQGGRKQKNIDGIKTFLDSDKQGNFLYMFPWYCDIKIEWEDKRFVELLRKEIAMINPITPMVLPPDRLHVAVHIRTGSGDDKVYQFRNVADDVGKHVEFPSTDMSVPVKFPPSSFFIEQLTRLSELLSDQPLYVHIFTDNRDPEKFVKLFMQEVNKPNIEYGFSKNDPLKSSGVLEDFFHMTQFEYFIRPWSWFSYMAEKLSNWKISISPSACSWKDNKVSVDVVDTIIRKTEASL